MQDTYRVVSGVNYEPSLGMVEYIDTERRLTKLLARVRSELGRFAVQFNLTEFDNDELFVQVIKKGMMDTVAAKGIAIRMPDLVPLENFLKEMRNEYRRWNFKAGFECSEIADEWLYQAMEPFKDLYERYVDGDADPTLLIEYMVDKLANDYALHARTEFTQPLATFRYIHTHRAKKGDPFALTLTIDSALMGNGQVYQLMVKLRE